MKETKAYTNYLGFATGATPPKIARKFKKASPSKKDLNLNLLLVDEEPKSAKINVHTKKTTRKQTSRVVIRDTHVESSSKRKEKIDVARGKGIKMISKVALTEEAQYEEFCKKSLRDFHKTRLSGSGTATKTAPKESCESEAESWGNDEDDNNNDNNSESDGSDDENIQSDNEKGSDSEHETDENESGFESNLEENKEEDETDEEEKEDEYVRTSSYYSTSDHEDKTNVDDNAEGDKDEEIDYTTSQLYDDVDIRLNEPVDTDKGFIQKEGTDAELTNYLQGNENPEISYVMEDAHVTLSTVPQKTEVPITSTSHSSDLASKVLNFSDIPHTDVEIVSPMDVHVHHEVPSNQTPTLLIVPVLFITKFSPIFTTIIPQSIPSFTPPPPQLTPTLPRTTEATNPPSTLLDFAYVFQFNRVSALEKDVSELKKDDPLKTQVTALVDEHLDARLGAIRDEFINYLLVMVTESLEHAVLAKESSQLQSSYEAAASLLEFELKKTLIDKMNKKRKTSKDAELTKGLKAKESQSGSSKGAQSQSKSSGKSVQSEEPETPQQGPTQSRLMTLASSADKRLKTFGELMSTPIDFSTYIMNGLKITNMTQETMLGPAFDFSKDNPEGGDFPFDLTKPIPLVKIGNRQKVSVDYFFNNDLNDLGRGYGKHGYGYLREIEVRRADNDLYTFKEGDFPRLRINDIKDMLILIVQNRLTNLSGDDVFDFTIALRMFTKIMVIQKRVEDLQLGVKSYQKNINVTKIETTRPGIRKKDPYTPYQDPQGFIYVDTLGRNRLMRSDKLYKFSDGTLTRLRTSLVDIIKNIKMEYLPQRRCSTLEKKRANI
nr:hypothetical protein [Tanacetum cinerariifolium]